MSRERYVHARLRKNGFPIKKKKKDRLRLELSRDGISESRGTGKLDCCGDVIFWCPDISADEDTRRGLNYTVFKNI